MLPESGDPVKLATGTVTGAVASTYAVRVKVTDVPNAFVAAREIEATEGI